MNLGLFFKISFWIILFIAAGLAARAAHEIEEYVFETVFSGDESIESTRVLWDVSECCSQKTNGFFQIMNALVGWRSIATVTFFKFYNLDCNRFCIFLLLVRGRTNRTFLESEKLKKIFNSKQSRIY